MSDAAQAGREMEGPFDMDKLWNEFHERVRCWLYRLVKNADLADELVGCVYVRVWKRQERYDPKRYTIRTWLYLNTRSVAYANLRRKRDNALSLDWIPEDRGLSCAGPEELYEAAEERARVWHAVDELPEMERRVVRARFHDGLSWVETARELGVSVRMAHYHMARAFVLLSELLQRQ
jgi:RNA polymerase sigma factor (sigma-70 family)